MGDVGWFAYAPDGLSPGPGPDEEPTPEEKTAASAQRSIPMSGVRRVTEEIGDDDLYAAFVEFLGCYGMAREVEPNVIRLDIADDMYPTGMELGQPLMVFLNRAQLRRMAWVADNIFDDRDPTVVPPTTRHVEIGFETLTFSLEEDFESGLGDNAGIRPGNLVYDGAVNTFRYRDDPPFADGT